MAERSETKLRMAQKPVHPGEMLKLEYLEQLDITPAMLADAIFVPLQMIERILAGSADVNADLATRLARYLRTSADFWLRCQSNYSLETLSRGVELSRELSRIEKTAAPSVANSLIQGAMEALAIAKGEAEPASSNISAVGIATAPQDLTSRPLPKHANGMSALKSPTHPGVVLAELFLAPMNMSLESFATTLGVEISQIKQLLDCKKGVTPETALRLGAAFKTSPTYWMNMQIAYDLADAELAIKDWQINPLAKQ